MRRLYEMVMDDRRNPLRHLDKPRRFQIMTVLAFMWTVIFCFAIGAWLWFDELMLAHLAVLLGIFLTGSTFYGAQRHTVREARRRSAGEGPR